MARTELDEFVREFLVESHENLDHLDQGLLALEKSPGDRDTLGSIFRTVHSIKGTSGFLGFGKLETLTHAGEGLLALMRDGQLRANEEITTALLALEDGARRILSSIETTGGEGDESWEALTQALTLLQTGKSTKASVDTAAPEASPGTPPAAASAPLPGEPTLSQAPPSPQPEEPSAATPLHAAAAGPAPGSAPAVPAEPGSRTPPETPPDASALADTTVRVDVGLLDKLMNLVGELVLARNQVLQFAGAKEDPGLTATSQRLNLVTTELQEGVMKTRMQPIGNVWSKFPRVGRDLAAACSKQVQIDMEGQATELDRTVIEAIKDPLTHLIRNAVDHGIESPGDRIRAGKPPTGRVSLRAFHEGGQVNIEISDDGAGIDPERVRTRAVQRGIVTSEQADRMREREVLNMIFLPGFSTAERVSNISGRGVGMDVVKTNIEKIGGTVDLHTRLGHGATVKIKIPLTLAIIPALIVTSDGERFAIPQVNLLELVRLSAEQAGAIELIHGSPVYRLRGNLLPLLYMRKLFELGGTLEAEADAARLRYEGETINIVVVQAGERQFGLVVAGVSDTEEIVVKPLGKQLKGIPTFAGATIMGDGRVALILDVLGIAQHANLISEGREHRETVDASSEHDPHGDRESFLLCAVGRDARMAIPLRDVDRLEDFPAHQIERAGSALVIQYRGQILPLLRLADLLPEDRRGEPPAEAPASVQVVVHAASCGRVGLVVENVIDIVEEQLVIERPALRPGVQGSGVLAGAVTEVLDVEAAIRCLAPALFAEAQGHPGSKAAA